MQGRGHQKAQVTEVKRVVCGGQLDRGLWHWGSLKGTGKQGVGVHLLSAWEGRPQAVNSFAERQVTLPRWEEVWLWGPG